MAIDLPANIGFRRVSFGLKTNTQKFVSPLNGSVQRILLPGARWQASYTYPMTDRNQAAAIQAFLMKLEGGVNTFNAYDPDAVTPRGAATGTPLVKGGSQTGSTLDIDGCTASVTNWLMAGDYFACNGQLHMLTQNADTNGSGEATLNFKPAMREAPADNAPITVTKATCEMALVDDGQTQWSSGAHLGIYDEMSFSAIEVFS